MDSSPGYGSGSTHDWAAAVDVGHLEHIRREAQVFAAGGTTHLILEVLAYAADEAGAVGATGQCLLTLHADGSVTVADNGRGTDTVHDPGGRPVRKPVMATRDLRFFDHPDAEQLPDGRPRRGMSVVAAPIRWLVHTNRRRDGAWMQRYERGIPVTDLVPIPDVEPEHTGTTVHFMPETAIRALFDTTAAGLRELTTAWPSLAPALGPDHRRQQAGLNPDHRGDERSCRGRCDHATPG